MWKGKRVYEAKRTAHWCVEACDYSYLTVSKTLTFEDRRDRRIYHKMARRICHKMARRMRSISTRISSGIDSDREIVEADILIN